MKYINETNVWLTLYTLSLGSLMHGFTQSNTETYIVWIFAIIWNIIAIVNKIEGSQE